MTARVRAQRIKSKAGYHHGDLRRQLVAAARRLVDKHGMDGFRMADAAALAGVSPAAPYRHFKDREALLGAAADDGFERLAASFAAVADEREEGGIEAIAALGKAYVGFARANPNVFRLMFAPHEGASADEADEPTLAGANTYGVLVRQVAAHLELAADAPSVLGTALSLWMFVHGFASLLIDDQLGVGRMKVDIDAMLEANTRQMLGAFVA